MLDTITNFALTYISRFSNKYKTVMSKYETKIR